MLPTAAQQYADTVGTASLREWLESYIEDEHAPPPLDCGRDLIVTVGSQDALSKTIEMLCDRGDPVLLEDPSYPGAIGPLQAAGCALAGVPVDTEGMVPSELERTLSEWAEGPKPRVLYLIPHGQNPSGSTMPMQRKEEIYAVAARHSLLIIEDDPYYALQYGDASNGSFASIDVDGRVLRLDSFSKVLGGGMRLGWASGPAPLIERLMLAQQVSTMQASTMSMTLAARLLHSWGLDKYRAHVREVRDFYAERRSFMQKCAEKHLTGLASWSAPSAGMFFCEIATATRWLSPPMLTRVLLVGFDLSPSGVSDSAPVILERCREQKVLLAPGNAFATRPGPSPFARAAFSIASDEVIDEALARLGAVLREVKAESENGVEATESITNEQ